MQNEKPFITVFIPTYNRGYIISHALQSCAASRFKDFEVIIVDDGSTDETESIVHEWQQKSLFTLTYIKQKNLGKPSAFNRAVELANGLLFLTLDSDDKLLPDALDGIYHAWNDIPESDRENYASIEGLCFENGAVTKQFPNDCIDSTYLEIRKIYNCVRERRSAYRVDVLKQFPYPVFEGEKFCRPRLIDLRMGHHYQTRFINHVLIDVGHEEDGISASRRKVTILSPRAYRQYFLEEIRDHAQFTPKSSLKSFYLRYSRHSFNCKVGVFAQFKEAPNKILLLRVLPEALLASYKDRQWKLKNLGNG